MGLTKTALATKHSNTFYNVFGFFIGQGLSNNLQRKKFGGTFFSFFLFAQSHLNEPRYVTSFSSISYCSDSENLSQLEWEHPFHRIRCPSQSAEQFNSHRCQPVKSLYFGNKEGTIIPDWRSDPYPIIKGEQNQVLLLQTRHYRYLAIGPGPSGLLPSNFFETQLFGKDVMDSSV